MPGTSLLDPKNDFVFKRLFASAPDLLTDLINCIRSDEAPIAVVEILNPHIAPEDLHGKFIVLDLLARDSQGQLYDVEMQVRRHAGYGLRSLYYLARTLGQQLSRGEHYSSLKPVIGIHLMDFELFPGAQAHWHFNLRDREYPGISLEGLHLHLIELPKAARQAATGATGLADWISYFEHWQEDSVMQDIQHPPVKDALERLQSLSNDTEERYRALARERALLDEAFYMDGARMEGGRAILTKQLNLKFGALPPPAQQRLQAASASELEQWSERILFAETLEDIFTPA